ncbi:NAD(P)H-dependent D-xylose reductase xyl1 [Trichoderma novae-zelandiae]
MRPRASLLSCGARALCINKSRPPSSCSSPPFIFLSAPSRARPTPHSKSSSSSSFRCFSSISQTGTMASPTIKLNSGYEMPQVGFGLWKVDNAVCADTVYNAIKAGYRLFDGACDYGNEKECGEGVARAIKDGLVKREDLFIVSKLWQTFHDVDKVEPIARRQLADWQVDYFDLFLIHFPAALEYVDPSVRYPPGWFYDGKGEVRWSKTTLQQTWGAMEGLVDKGLARSIGVSNYQAQSVYDALIYARIRPATLQIEHHPYLQQPDLVSLAQTEGIVVTAYSSFGPTGFMELDMPRAKSVAPLMENPVIKAVAAKHSRTPAQVLLRWATQRGLAVIPKTSRPEVMTQNLDSTSFDLDSEDLAKIADMDLNIRFNKPTNYFSANKLYLFG